MPAPALTDDDVRAIVETTARRVVRLCQRRGLFEMVGYELLVSWPGEEAAEVDPGAAPDSTAGS